MDRFKKSPIHDKRAILGMLDELPPDKMINVVNFIKDQLAEKPVSLPWNELERGDKVVFDRVYSKYLTVGRKYIVEDYPIFLRRGDITFPIKNDVGRKYWVKVENGRCFVRRCNDF